MKKMIVELLCAAMVMTVATTNMIATFDDDRATEPDHNFELFDTDVVEFLEKVREA